MARRPKLASRGAASERPERTVIDSPAEARSLKLAGGGRSPFLPFFLVSSPLLSPSLPICFRSTQHDSHHRKDPGAPQPPPGLLAVWGTYVKKVEGRHLFLPCDFLGCSWFLPLESAHEIFLPASCAYPPLPLSPAKQRSGLIGLGPASRARHPWCGGWGTAAWARQPRLAGGGVVPRTCFVVAATGAHPSGLVGAERRGHAHGVVAAHRTSLCRMSLLRPVARMHSKERGESILAHLSPRSQKCKLLCLLCWRSLHCEQ
jgi:hypothetical protein